MDKSKSYMHIALTIALLVGAYAALSYVNTYSASVEPSSFRSFTVTAQGKVVTVPDVAEFNFSVVTEGGKDVGSLQGTNTEKMNKAIDFVKLSGVDAKDVRTSGYSINPRYQYYNCGQSITSGVVQPCPPAEVVGYTITQNVEVKIRDFSKIGDILSGVVKSGANSVSQLQFTIDDPEKAKNDARADAIEKAKTQAEEIADAAGFSVGRLLSVDESGYSPMYYDSMRSMKVMSNGVGAEAVPAPSIEPGSQEVNVTVSLRYEIR